MGIRGTLYLEGGRPQNEEKVETTCEYLHSYVSIAIFVVFD